MPSTVLRLGDKLVAGGHITDEQLRLALRKQKKTRNKLLGEALVELGFLDERLLAGIISSDAGYDFIDISTVVCSEEALKLVPQEIAEQYTCIPFDIKDDALYLAMSNVMDLTVIDKVERYSGYHVRPFSAAVHDIINAIETFYVKLNSFEDIVDNLLEINANEIDTVEDSPIVQLIEATLSDAVRNRATDIHFEPEEKWFQIRYRIDGEMVRRSLLAETVSEAIAARIKVISGLDVSERRLGQDGRFSRKIGSSDVEFRVSTLPAAHGENIVIRILNKDAVKLEMSALGMSKEMQHKITKDLRSQHGLILVTGATGSGKSTSLYTMLSNIDSKKKSIFTVEDPIENKMHGIQQILVDEEHGTGFSNVLSTILRQDPDVVMVGEMRDTTTARLALQAAQTGHLVLSTLHTNSAVDTVNRLMNMGIEDYIIADTLLGVVSQKLVRKLCPHCKKPKSKEESKRIIEAINVPYTIPENAEIYHAEGCEKCNGKGVVGRIGIYEYLKIDSSLYDAIVSRNKNRIEETATSKGFKTMIHDGIEKALSGVVALEDVLVAGSYA